METDCKLNSNDDVQELLQFAKCSFDQKKVFDSEIALLQARIQNPWNNSIQKNLSIVTQEKNFDIPPNHLWALRLPFELWILLFFAALFGARKYWDFKNYFLSFGICCLGLSVWTFTQEQKFHSWTVLNESTAVYSLPNLNYEQERLKKGSLVYLKKQEQGFSRILYKDKTSFVPTEKLFPNTLLNDQGIILKQYLDDLFVKIKKVFS